MAGSKHIERIAIVGAGGRIGKSFADELLRTGKHTITALTRKGSKSVLPNGVKIVEVDYDDENSIVSALQGQQFLIITLAATAPSDLHGKIIQAASKAGVAYVMPNIFGGDVMNPSVIEGNVLSSVYKERMKDCKSSGMSYIILVCGQWYEWSLGLPEPWFGFDIRKRTVTFFDQGTTAINVSTWLQCGRAIAALLSLPESGPSPCVADWKNGPLYISSFRLSQRDMLDSLERVTGTTDQDWTFSYEPTEERYERGLKELKGGDRMGFARALYAHAFKPGIGGDFESKRTLSNETLGLPREDLDEATKRTVEWVEDGFVESVFGNVYNKSS